MVNQWLISRKQRCIMRQGETRLYSRQGSVCNRRYSNRSKPGGRIKQPFALYAPLLVPPSWILDWSPSVAALRHASHVAMQQPELRQNDTRVPDFADRKRERKQNNMRERLPGSIKNGGGQGPRYRQNCVLFNLFSDPKSKISNLIGKI